MIGAAGNDTNHDGHPLVTLQRSFRPVVGVLDRQVVEFHDRRDVCFFILHKR